MERPVALTVAGSDSGGGAGVVADAKTFAARGVWAGVAITAITAQHAGGIRRVEVLDPSLVRAQMESVAEGLSVGAAKTGMLGSAPVVTVVGEFLAERGWPLVVDPVLVSTSGTPLLEPAAVEVVRDRLLPAAWVVTPNLEEAMALTGLPVRTAGEMEAAGRALVALGCRAALV
ncbi:MAG TPA: bifunctional hydroxymethylpyrimidine kinase/phosphomethylpyrimidine kinase, partial [Acidimicrobiales bacterium]